MKPDGHRRRPTQKAKQQNQNQTLEGSLKNIQRPPCGPNLRCLEACCLRSCLVKAFSHLPIASLHLPGVSCGHMHFLLHASFTHSPTCHPPPFDLPPSCNGWGWGWEQLLRTQRNLCHRQRLNNSFSSAFYFLCVLCRLCLKSKEAPLSANSRFSYLFIYLFAVRTHDFHSMALPSVHPLHPLHPLLFSHRTPNHRFLTLV